jgi:site-specific DNA recombinase
VQDYSSSASSFGSSSSFAESSSTLTSGVGLPRSSPRTQLGPSAQRGGREQFRVVIDQDRLEECVFETVTGWIRDDPYWAQGRAKREPDTDDKITILEGERDELIDQRTRAARAYVAGIMTERESADEVTRLNAEIEAVVHRVNDLLGKPALSLAIGDGLNWRDWSADRRRNFLKLTGIRVEVGLWPEGMSRNLPPFKDESAEHLAERRDAHLRAVVAQGVSITVG